MPGTRLGGGAIAEASDNLGIQALARPVEKHYLAWPRWLGAEPSF